MELEPGIFDQTPKSDPNWRFPNGPSIKAAASHVLFKGQGSESRVSPKPPGYEPRSQIFPMAPNMGPCFLLVVDNGVINYNSLFEGFRARGS